MLSGNNENMDGSKRIDVRKGYQFIILVTDVGGYFSLNDFTEYTIYQF
jgi:hypothetical protein